MVAKTGFIEDEKARKRQRTGRTAVGNIFDLIEMAY